MKSGLSAAAAITARCVSDVSRSSRSRIESASRLGSPRPTTSARPRSSTSRCSSCSPRSNSTIRNGLPWALAAKFSKARSASRSSTSATIRATASSDNGPTFTSCAPSRFNLETVSSTAPRRPRPRSVRTQTIGVPESHAGSARRAARVPASAHCKSSIRIARGDSRAACSNAVCRSWSIQ